MKPKIILLQVDAKKLENNYILNLILNKKLSSIQLYQLWEKKILLKKKTKNCFYINGLGGSGKPIIYNTLYNILSGKGKTICTMALTGIAATLLPKGRTVHNIFGLPVPLLGDSSSNITVESSKGGYLKNFYVLIWDEAPMAPRCALSIMNKLLQQIMQNNTLIGGKIVILGGDFRQLLPVRKGGNKNETLDLSIKFADEWKHFENFKLHVNMRALTDEKHFAEYLLRIGNGDDIDKDNNIELSSNCMKFNFNITKIFAKYIATWPVYVATYGF